MAKFEDLMYDFGFIERTSFLRVLIDYVYNHKVSPIEGEVIEKFKKTLEDDGYKVLRIVPILNGDLYACVENPRTRPGRRKPGKKGEHSLTPNLVQS